MYIQARPYFPIYHTVSGDSVQEEYLYSVGSRRAQTILGILLWLGGTGVILDFMVSTKKFPIEPSLALGLIVGAIIGGPFILLANRKKPTSTVPDTTPLLPTNQTSTPQNTATALPQNTTISTENIEQLTTRISDIEQTIAAYQSRLTTVQSITDAEEVNARINELREELNQLHTRSTQYESALSQLSLAPELPERLRKIQNRLTALDARFDGQNPVSRWPSFLLGILGVLTGTTILTLFLLSRNLFKIKSKKGK